VTATLAAGIAPPDLSATLPLKLPVAWPRRAGTNVIASTQTTARRSVLEDFALAKNFTNLKQFAPKQFTAIWVLFIVMPLSSEVVLHRLRIVSVQPPKNSQFVSCRLGKNGFTGPAVGNERSQGVNSEALVFSLETGRDCNDACENLQ
jgi:hypothetical protein